MKRCVRLLLPVLLLTGMISFGSSPSRAAGRLVDTVDCAGQTLTILTQPSNSDIGWGSVQVVGGGHLTPLSFSFSLVDNTIGETLFADSTVRGNGSIPSGLASRVVTCTQSFTGTLGDFFESGEPLPPGTALTDSVTFTLEAVVFQKA